MKPTSQTVSQHITTNCYYLLIDCSYRSPTTIIPMKNDNNDDADDGSGAVIASVCVLVLAFIALLLVVSLVIIDLTKKRKR